MSNRLFVGNLPYDATEDEIRDHFAQAGSVGRVFVPLDRDTGRPRGFAFVEFEDPAHASGAIQLLHEQPFKDRPLVVNAARPNEARPAGGSRPPMGGGRPPSAPRGAPPGGASGPGEGKEERKPARFASPSKPRRRGGKRGGWEEGPRKEPIPEKRRSQMLGGYDDVEEDEEDIEFENLAVSLPDSETSDSEAADSEVTDSESADSESADSEVADTEVSDSGDAEQES